MPTPTTIFNPAPSVADRVLDAIADPRLSLADIAQAHKTTIESITLWMTREDIRERLVATESAHAWRTRLVATAHLPKALSALTHILDDLQASRATDRGSGGERSVPNAHDAPASSSSPLPPITPSPNPLRLALLHHRRIETARKSATTILRLTHFQPLPYNAVRTRRDDSGAQPRPPRTFSPSPPPSHPPRHIPHPTSVPTPDQTEALADMLRAPAPAAQRPTRPPAQVSTIAAPARPGATAGSHPTPAIPHPTLNRFARSPVSRILEAAGAAPASPRAP